MANAERGEASVVVNGTSYTLKLSMNAAAEMQSRRNERLATTLAAVGGGDVIAIRDFVFALLQKFHGDAITTVEQAGDFMDEAGEALGESIAALMQVNAPPEGAENPPGAQPTTVSKRSASKRSGPG